MVQVKELVELIEGLQVVAVAGVKVAKDGKIGADDLVVLVELGSQISKVAEAVQGLELIKEEIKDLQVAEAQEVIAKIYALADAVKAAKA